MKIITLHPGIAAREVQRQLQALGLWTTPMSAPDGAVQLLAQSDSAHVADDALLAVEGVAQVWSTRGGHPKVDAQGGVVQVSGVVFDDTPVLLAGPCSVESEAQIHEAAGMVAAAGARFLRGGCFKPRTSPYSFQGVGVEGLGWMREAADAYGLGVVTEAMSAAQVEPVAEVADLIQIGARNMQNFALLHAVGRAKRPVLLKRGLSATIDEWLLAGEHLMDSGAPVVIFCERGVRGFDGQTRFMMDLAAVALLRDVHGVPVIADPSHATGRKDLIPRMGAAAMAAGAQGLIIETHPRPQEACSDGPQQLNPEELAAAASMWGFAPAEHTANKLRAVT